MGLPPPSPISRSRQGRGRAKRTDTSSVRTAVKPASSEQATDALLARHAEDPRGLGLRWRYVAPLDENPAGDRAHGLRSGAPPGGKRQAPVGAQHTARLRERRGRVRHQHVAALAKHAVDRVGVQADALGIDHSVVDVRSPSSAPRRRATSIMSEEKSVEISRPPSPTIAAPSKPVHPCRHQARATSHQAVARTRLSATLAPGLGPRSDALVVAPNRAPSPARSRG